MACCCTLHAPWRILWQMSSHRVSMMSRKRNIPAIALGCRRCLVWTGTDQIPLEILRPPCIAQ